MAEAIQAGVQAGVQAAFAANAANAAHVAQPQRQHRNNNPVFDEQDDDIDDENPFGDDRPHRQQQHDRHNRNNDDLRWTSGLKLEIPEFNGGSQPEDLLDWFVTVDEIIEFKDVPEQKKVPLVTTRFRGHAAAWWSQLKLSRTRRGKDKITSWDKLKKHMRKIFIPYSFERLLFQKFHNIRQGSRSVEDYAKEFYQMLTRIDVHDSEDQLVARFIAGLRPQLQNMLQQFDPSSVSEARQRALLVEQQSRATNNQWPVNSRIRTTTPTDDTNTSTGRDTTATSTTGQRNNARPTETVTPTAEPRPSRPNALRCFTCGERGHIQTAYPLNKGRRGLLANDREIIGDPIYDDDEEQFDDVDEEQVYGDIGTCLMIRRNCMAPKTNEAWQRTSLFISTCTVKGKISRFVIDSGCSANVVSEEAVRKLSLTPEAHPHPYRLLWMQTGAEVYVSQRALVSLSVGLFYKDTLYCDIATMDVSHLILGRPWQYDREVLHNGKTNTHSFMFEGRKITLLPSPETDKAPSSTTQHTSSKQNLLIISKSQFEDELRTCSPIFSLVALTPPPPQQLPCPPAFTPILKEFEDLFPEELPSGLPPL
ncbi:uncharacterized protein LOC125588388 [Brassica napus]|uniref:uncharacterized protein LOC106297423 n=1 Tax=Brassica oleracea var. oleracea TaxID=109376 RepID=UPI0006A6C76E|nr:PREDICTED: uncharacterized protein LOC106297423 [Brassica oleracea var. oleracea]XP_048615663.1 uncharacterized protein LOC125588388 [Brassica napus]